MAENAPKEKPKSCEGRCDEEFIRCVENYRTRCLDQYKDCSSSCQTS